MARGRIIKPEFWDDEKLAEISRDARLLFIGMWNHSDDYGVIKGNIKWLKAQIFPYDEISYECFENWLNEVINKNFILKFTSDGQQYFLIKNFYKHQKVEKPSKTRNAIPPPEITLPEHSPNTPRMVVDEGKGREVKLSKGEGKDELPPPNISFEEFLEEFKKEKDYNKWKKYEIKWYFVQVGIKFPDITIREKIKKVKTFISSDLKSDKYNPRMEPDSNAGYSEEAVELVKTNQKWLNMKCKGDFDVEELTKELIDKSDKKDDYVFFIEVKFLLKSIYENKNNKYSKM